MTEIIQGSPEWFAVRIGKVTASRVADVVAKTKTGWGASRTNYMAELIAERLTGNRSESYTNPAMQWGKDHEEEARNAYEFIKDVSVELIGFVDHPTIAMSGSSPDGLVGDDGLVEIKCPNTATHIDTLLGQAIPSKYDMQIQWQLACTGRKWCDFVSFDPRLPPSMQLFVQRVDRNEATISDLENQVPAFLQELTMRVDALNKLYGKIAA